MSTGVYLNRNPASATSGLWHHSTRETKRRLTKFFNIRRLDYLHREFY